jgi:DNA-binding LytR/AlgR family response regulator
MKMKCIAIDDEQLALNKIVRYSEKLDYLKVEATFLNAIEAIPYLRKNKIDLIFLDIQMDGFSGIEFLEVLKNLPYVIITSAFNSYAIKSYEFNVIDYLLKPIEFPRFVKAVEKVFAHYQKDLKLDLVKEEKEKAAPHSILVKSGREMIRITTADILYIEGMKDYLSIVTEERKILTLMSFDVILDQLPEDIFCRVHKSYIVNFIKIENVKDRIIKIKDKEIPITNTYILNFKEKIKRYKLLYE